MLTDCKDITAQAEFTPQESGGSVEVACTFDTRMLAEKEIVVLGSILLDDVEIANHKNINDANQTVKFRMPQIGTSTTEADGNKLIPASEITQIIDT